jgi:D-beta-D-heptose 7-phosphate kinase/D-beta-D-heptose 1-phosphate adenosyltransferase
MIHVIGDLLVDHTIHGSVTRISPEAPTPVVLVNSETYVLGGAGNVYLNCQSLNQHAVLYTAANPETVKWLLSTYGAAESCGIFASSDSSYQTPIKLRVCSSGQQLLRIDRENPGGLISNAVANNVLTAFEKNLGCCSVIVVADYGKGLFNAERAQRVLAAARRYSIPVLVDAKPKQLVLWKQATLCTPNREEAIAVATAENFFDLGLLSDDKSDMALSAASYIRETYGMEHVVLTQGEDGAALVSPRADGTRYYKEFKAVPVRVYDVTGAGDSFMAALATGIQRGWALEACVARAVWAGSLAVQEHGVIAVDECAWDDAWRLAGGPSGKILSMSDAVKYVNSRRRCGKKIVLTNGCFDVLHAGHLSMLTTARSYGDELLVAVDSDANVTRLKGPGRPMTNQNLRQLQLATLPLVNRVTMFDGSMEDVVRLLKPDVLVKGGDYKDKEIIGGDYVKTQLGGLVVATEYTADISTTRWVEASDKA